MRSMLQECCHSPVIGNSKLSAIPIDPLQTHTIGQIIMLNLGQLIPVLPF